MSARLHRDYEPARSPTSVAERFPIVESCVVEVEQWRGSDPARETMEDIVHCVPRNCARCAGDEFDPLPVIAQMVKHRRTHLHREVPCPERSAACAGRFLYRIAIIYRDQSER